MRTVISSYTQRKFYAFTRYERSSVDMHNVLYRSVPQI